jgi:hypothetical protein
MKRLLFALLLVSAVLPLEAQTRWGVRAGITEGEPMIGVEFVRPIFGDFVINPNIEFTSELFSANADVHYDFDISNQTSFWVGAGLAFINPDEDDFEGGVNLFGGVGTTRGRLYPYAQLKLTSATDIGDLTSVALGVRF